jgi:ketosteroid isomerase-like protein
MSQENVETAQQQVDAVNRRDADAFVAVVSPDVEWEDSIFWSEGSRTYRGRTEVREWFDHVVVEPWESLLCEAEEILAAADDRVFFGGVLTARGKESGVDTRLHFWSVTWVANGLITRRQVFLERAEALEAAGLSE